MITRPVIVGMLIVLVTILPAAAAKKATPAEAAFERAKLQVRAERLQIGKKIKALKTSGAQIFLFSLNPGDPRGYAVNNARIFHGFPILGSTKIDDSDEKAGLVTSLATAVLDFDALPLYCFKPRHGLRIIHGATRSDFLICFECQNMHIYGFHGYSGCQVGAGASTYYERLLKKYRLALPVD